MGMKTDKWKDEIIPFADEDGIFAYFPAYRCCSCGGIVFDEAQAFTYCPYCGKKLREEDNE